MKARNSPAIRRLRPSTLFRLRPRFNRSASLSICNHVKEWLWWSPDNTRLDVVQVHAAVRTRSTISRVKLQSNSLTVHFTCKRTSRRSCILKRGKVSPWYRCMSSRARVVKGVWTDTVRPFMRAQFLGLARPRIILSTRALLFSSRAPRFRRSMVCRSLVSCTRYPKFSGTCMFRSYSKFPKISSPRCTTDGA